MKRIYIYWEDLTPEKRQEIQEALHMEPDDDGNWTVVPMTVIEIEEEET